MTELQLHPLCILFPRMVGPEFDALVIDIKANGQREPIILHEGMILDGGNRYKACLEAGVEPQTMKFGGGNLVSYVLSANLHRRHMSPGQQAAIVASCQDWQNAEKAGGDRKSDQSAMLHFDRATDRAAISGASIRTQKNADKVAKEDPELAIQVAHGEKTLPQAVKEIADKKPKKPKPEKPKKFVAHEPDDGGYTEVDALEDQVDELRGMLAVAHMKESTDEEKTIYSDLLSSLQKELKTANLVIKAITRSRDQLMLENGSLKRHIAMLQKQIKKAA